MLPPRIPRDEITRLPNRAKVALAARTSLRAERAPTELGPDHWHVQELASDVAVIYAIDPVVAAYCERYLPLLLERLREPVSRSAIATLQAMLHDADGECTDACILTIDLALDKAREGAIDWTQLELATESDLKFLAGEEPLESLFRLPLWPGDGSAVNQLWHFWREVPVREAAWTVLSELDSSLVYLVPAESKSAIAEEEVQPRQPGPLERAKQPPRIRKDEITRLPNRAKVALAARTSLRAELLAPTGLSLQRLYQKYSSDVAVIYAIDPVVATHCERYLPLLLERLREPVWRSAIATLQAMLHDADGECTDACILTIELALDKTREGAIDWTQLELATESDLKFLAGEEPLESLFRLPLWPGSGSAVNQLWHFWREVPVRDATRTVLKQLGVQFPPREILWKEPGVKGGSGPAEDRGSVPAEDSGFAGGSDLAEESGFVEEPTGVQLGPLKPGAKQPPQAPRQRVVSTGFANTTRPEAPLSPRRPLRCGGEYLFWLEAGEPVRGAIDTAARWLPTELLPPSARLRVALFAFDNEIALSGTGDVGEIELLSDGAARVVSQPRDCERFSLGELGERRLFFPVRMPPSAGRFHLRCNIYYRQLLLQSRLVTVRVAQQPGLLLRGALRTDVEYAINRSLSPQTLNEIQEHRLSVMLNDNPRDETVQFRFLGAEGSNNLKLDASLGEAQTSTLIDEARDSLRRVAWGSEGEWSGDVHTYRYGSRPSDTMFAKDLVSLARAGFRLYDAIAVVLEKSARAGLEELLLAPGLLQIAVKESAGSAWPAALVYDQPFDPDLECTICPAFLLALENNWPLEETACFRGGCPSRAFSNVVCPSGFWGFRHMIGVPVSRRGGDDVPTSLGCSHSPGVGVAISCDPQFVRWPAHSTRLAELMEWNPSGAARTRAATFDMLKQPNHLVYFYCHGGIDGRLPYLRVGPPNEAVITRASLRGNRIAWTQPGPLVFINGCHTAALNPAAAFDLVSGFISARAAGVIGTEITIFEPLACAFAETFFQEFLLAGANVGHAVQRARLRLLQEQRNPLGLVYVPYALASLTR
jgi:hypothetical protein